MGGVKSAREAQLELTLENVAYVLRAQAERTHGCNIGFDPWEPCDCPAGAEAGRLWRLARNIKPAKPGVPK